MKKIFLLIIPLLFIAMSGWAQTAGNPVATIGTPAVCYGATSVDVPITVSNLYDGVSATNSIGSFSLEFHFDATKLAIPKVVDLYSGLLANDGAETPSFYWTIDSTTNLTYLGSGKFKIVGITSSGHEISFTDATVLFKLRFTLLPGFTPSTSNITFYENTQGTSCEFAGLADAFNVYTDYTTNPGDGIGTYYKNGSATLDANFTPGAILTTGQTICTGGDPSSIGNSTASSGGDESITYKWKPKR